MEIDLNPKPQTPAKISSRKAIQNRKLRTFFELPTAHRCEIPQELSTYVSHFKATQPSWKSEHHPNMLTSR